MKILCISDLHIYKKLDKHSKQYQWIKSILKCKPDTIVITGDIFESQYQIKINPYDVLTELFGNIPVICTLGNHEFVCNTVEGTLNYYKNTYKNNNVHYLDVIDYYDIGDIRFLGNVLWYDGSMANYHNQNLKSFADGRWLDKTIIDFDFITECEKCKNKIKQSISKDKINILCTHTVPHHSLNLWYGEEINQFNAYSGIYDLLKDIDVQYSISGHTHRKIIGKTIYNCQCINTGNDYYAPFTSYLLEV